MAGTTQYTTTQPERWDLIAFKAYGDALRFPEICAANPDVALLAKVPQGTRLNIPISETAAENVNLLPPWKR